jgi:hypothetical protein
MCEWGPRGIHALFQFIIHEQTVKVVAWFDGGFSDSSKATTIVCVRVIGRSRSYSFPLFRQVVLHDKAANSLDTELLAAKLAAQALETLRLFLHGTAPINT